VTNSPEGTPEQNGPDDSARSEDACPRCGAHRLALLQMPEIDLTDYHPLDEAIGMGMTPSLEQPAIGCLACGAQWPDVGALRAEEHAH
jgi:hypothetical protein